MSGANQWRRCWCRRNRWSGLRYVNGLTSKLLPFDRNLRWSEQQGEGWRSSSPMVVVAVRLKVLARERAIGGRTGSEGVKEPGNLPWHMPGTPAIKLAMLRWAFCYIDILWNSLHIGIIRGRRHAWLHWWPRKRPQARMLRLCDALLLQRQNILPCIVSFFAWLLDPLISFPKWWHFVQQQGRLKCYNKNMRK